MDPTQQPPGPPEHDPNERPSSPDLHAPQYPPQYPPQPQYPPPYQQQPGAPGEQPSQSTPPFAGPPAYPPPPYGQQSQYGQPQYPQPPFGQQQPDGRQQYPPQYPPQYPGQYPPQYPPQYPGQYPPQDPRGGPSADYPGQATTGQYPGPYAQTATYAATANAKGGRRGVVLAAILGLAVVVALAAIGFFALNLGNPDRGKVLFSTSPAANDSCSLPSPVTEVAVGQKFHFMAILRDEMTGTDAITVTVRKDGQPVATWNDDASTGTFGCYGTGAGSAYGPLVAGTYTFTVTHDSTVEAEGTVTVK